MDRISVKGLALGLGVTWGISMLLIGLLSISGWGIRIVEVLSSLYIGFAPSFFGSLIGAVWGFVDGAIGGIIIALVYNAVVKKR